MGSVGSTGRFLKGNSQRKARKFLCLAVSAMALLTILAPVVFADASSADTGDPPFTIKFVDVNDREIDKDHEPLITNYTIPFDTETSGNGTVYSLKADIKIDSTRAYFRIQAKDGAHPDEDLEDQLFKVTVSIENLAAWMDNFGIRVKANEAGSVGHVGTADLRSGNSYNGAFMEGEKEKAFELDKWYSISFYTLDGSYQSATAPDSIGNFRISLSAEIIPGLHKIRFLSENAAEEMEVVETRALYEHEQLGILPLLEIQGNTFLGWYDSEGKEVTADTYVRDLPSDDITAKWEWPHIRHWTDSWTNSDGSTTVGDYTELTYRDGSTKLKVIEITTYPDGKKDREESSESKDPDGNVTEDSQSSTEITPHSDGSETWNTDTTKNNKDGTSEEYKIITEYDSGGTMVSEVKEAKLTDADKNSREYEVTAELNDEKEKKYRVEAIIPETTILDIDNAKKLIDEYDYSVAVVGTHSDDGLIIVPDDVMDEVAKHGYYLSVSNSEQYVAVDDAVVKDLAKQGGEVRLWTTTNTEGKINEDQANTIGSRYAFSVTLTVDGKEVSQLNGYAEISLDPELVKNGKVMLVNDDGTVEELPVRVDPITGKVTYLTNHLSIFMIQEEETEDDYEFAFPYMWVTIAEFMLIPAVAFGVIRHWRRKNRV